MRIILISALFLSGIAINAQEITHMKFSSGITAEELQDHVRILASEDFQGRETGYPGQKKAAEYILDQFILLGLASPAYQTFELIKNEWESFKIVENGDTLKINEHINVNGYWPEGENRYKLIFAGYGAETDHYSDYTGIEVKGKIVAFLNGEPMDKDGRFLTTGSFIPEYSIIGSDKAAIAIEKGALGAIMIERDPDRVEQLIRLNKKFSISRQFFLHTGNTQAGVISCDMENASLLFNNDKDDWDKYRKKLDKGKTPDRTIETEIAIIAERGPNKITSENVIGMIKGSEKPEEFIIITAHYDHLGKRDDEIFYGADDNASGTAAVIEIAEAFREAALSNIRPRRSILFMPVSGEEKGLLGSKHYVNDPIVPLSKTRAAINMDMIGRQDDMAETDSSYVYLYVSDKPGSLLDQAARKSDSLAGGQMMIEYKYKSSAEINIGGSDHASFEKAGIPVLYFYCGLHDDYHRPGDTWEKLDYVNMANIARLVFAATWELANE